jgi:hypothetical protein
MANPDANVAVGTVFDYEGGSREILRDFDTIVIPAMTLDAQGVAQLRQALDDGMTGIGEYLKREDGEAADDLCAWHGGEGEGHAGCSGCREDQDAGRFLRLPATTAPEGGQ